MPPRLPRPAVVLLATVVLGVTGWGMAGYLRPGDRPAIDPTDAAQVALGLRVYEQNCAQCHGAGLEGQPDWKSRRADGRLPAPPHDPSGHTWHHPDQVLFDIIKNGMKPPVAPAGYESDMPGYADILSDAEIAAVIAYIQAQWPADIRARQRQIDASAR